RVFVSSRLGGIGCARSATKARGSKNLEDVVRGLSAGEGAEEVRVRFRLGELFEEELHAFCDREGVEHLPENPDPSEVGRTDKQFLFSGARLVDVDGGENPAVHQFPIQVELHVAGSFELLK